MKGRGERQLELLTAAALCCRRSQQHGAPEACVRIDAADRRASRQSVEADIATHAVGGDWSATNSEGAAAWFPGHDGRE